MGLGYPNESLLELAAKFSGSQLCDKIGTYITKMSYDLAQDVGDNNKLTFRVYGPDKANAPGELLAEFVKNNAVLGWNEITFPDPILINTNEIWISVEFFQFEATHPIGVDIGPLVVGHNFTRRNGGTWSEFTQTEFGNFSIRAVSTGKVIPACWLSLTGNTFGNVPKGTEKTFNANFNTTGLDVGVYKANIKVRTNDEERPMFTIPCILTTASGPFMSVDVKSISEEILKEEDKPTNITKTITVSNNGNESGDYEAKVEGTADWLTLTGETSATVPAGENKTFDAVLEAAELATGTYDATIVITTNDEHNPKFEIPCTLRVEHVGIDDYTIQTLVFPNPTTGMVQVQSNTIINNIQLFNNVGQMVYSSTVNGDNTSFDTSNFGAGLYFIKVNTDKGSHSVKLMVK